ncbi:CDP-glucose 4,6-dehydratase, partial [Candidatus Electrothrix marina]
HEATYLKLDCSKSKNLLGWTPSLNLATALQWVVQWYQAYSKGRDMLQVTRDDIKKYESLLRNYDI